MEPFCPRGPDTSQALRPGGPVCAIATCALSWRGAISRPDALWASRVRYAPGAGTVDAPNFCMKAAIAISLVSGFRGAGSHGNLNFRKAAFAFVSSALPGLA